VLDQTDGAQTGNNKMVIKRISEDATEGRSTDGTSEAMEDHHEEQRRKEKGRSTARTR
jgi:hypothetical protein